MKADNDELKRVLNEYFGSWVISRIAGGGTDANLLRIKTVRQENFVLKAQQEGLRQECLNYRWLEGKVPVPKVVFYDKIEEYDVLCLTI